jgi:dienelactone hydrolase
VIDGFDAQPIELAGVERTVYFRGDGPPVVVMHEIPGLTPKVAAFARRVADRGFTVAVPVLFGTPNKPLSVPYLLGAQIRACVSHEFSLLAKHQASPVTEWLRALCRKLHEDHAGAGVGAIGMCITGNFALALMVDPWLMAPVLSQPSLPLGITAAHRAALHVSPAALETIKKRAVEEGVSVLAMRFTGDKLCPRDRFETLRRELGDRFEGIEIDSSPGNPHGHRRIAHSVVTEDLIDEEGQPTRAALERVLTFFEERLRASVAASPASSRP